MGNCTSTQWYSRKLEVQVTALSRPVQSVQVAQVVAQPAEALAEPIWAAVWLAQARGGGGMVVLQVKAQVRQVQAAVGQHRAMG